jgi:hypothetical protein
VLVFTSLHGDTFAGRRAALEIPEIPERFADAPAIVLYHGTSLHVAPKLERSHLWTRRRVLIQNEDGLDQANQTYVVSTKFFEVSDVDARLYPPGGGRPERIDDDFVRVQNYVRMGREDLAESIQITYPGAVPGSVVEYTIELESDEAARGQVWRAQNDIPTLRTTFVARASVPSYEFHATSFPRNRELFDAHCEWETPDLDGRVPSQRLVCLDVPGFRDEPHAPARADTLLRVDIGVSSSTFNLRRFWDVHKEWLVEDVAAYLEGDESVEGIVDELSGSPEFEDDPVEAIQAWMSEHLTLDPERDCALLKIDADGERNEETLERYDEGDVCRTAGEVVAEGSGDAWELTFAQVALLREANVESYFARAVDRRRGEYFRRAPFEQFRRLVHPLVMIRDEAGIRFRDATCAECPRGMMPWYLKGDGSAVFPLSPWSRTPIPLAASPTSDNLIAIDDVLTVTPDGRARCEGRKTWAGDAEIAKRQSWKRVEGEAELKREQAAALGLEPEMVSVTPLAADSEHGFGISYEMDASSQVTSLVGRLLVPAPGMPPSIADLPLAEERTHPLMLGYGRSVTTRRRVVVPPGFAVDETPDPVVLEAPGLSYEATWTTRGDQEIVFRSELVLDRDRWEVGEYPALRDALLGIEDSLRRRVVLAPLPESEATAATVKDTEDAR